MIVFTICSKNFLGYASSLHSSLREHHEDLQFYAALCDTATDLDVEGLNFNVLTMEQLGIPKLNSMIERYNITELNTSIKPFVFSYLFEAHPGEVVYYFDPDILIRSRMIELEACFENGADCVLTPHILEPAEYAEMQDREFLTYGIYNLGFCALRDTPEVRRAVSWWGRRLEDYCVIDLEHGIFVDQKWADLLPAFISNTKILRHPGYNVAYWNLSQRRLRRAADGHWTVNNLPLRFFHFSGNKIEDEAIFSRHSSQFRIDNSGDLGLLLAEYRKNVFDHGHKYFSTFQYGYRWNGAGGENRHTPASVSEARVASNNNVRPYLSLEEHASKASFDRVRALNAKVIFSRFNIECENIPANEEAFTLPGYCACCDRYSSFQVSGMYSSRRLPDGRVFPNWREHLNCLECGLVNRVRASLQIFRQIFDPKNDDSIYMTEYKTQTFQWVSRRYSNVQGSEYFEGDHSSGDIIDGIRHEDVQAMSYPNNAFKYILSFDVLEHVPDHKKAFLELYRCLQPGGALIFTVPFSWGASEHVTRAILHEDGSLEHLMEPEYHGNPVDMEAGSLCFRYFGWSTIDDLKNAGFCDVKVLNYWSNDLKYFGDPQFVFVAQKR